MDDIHNSSSNVVLLEGVTGSGKTELYLRLTKEEASNIEVADNAKPRPEGDRLAGSYVNFYMGDEFIILPKFNVAEDLEAYNILNDFYKGSKKIHQIESRKILVAGGNIHCITMQIGKEH